MKRTISPKLTIQTIKQGQCCSETCKLLFVDWIGERSCFFFGKLKDDGAHPIRHRKCMEA